MKLAIGRMERALTRIEQAVDALPEQPMPPLHNEKAIEALKALDALIGELKGAPHG